MEICVNLFKLRYLIDKLSRTIPQLNRVFSLKWIANNNYPANLPIFLSIIAAELFRLKIPEMVIFLLQRVR